MKTKPNLRDLTKATSNTPVKKKAENLDEVAQLKKALAAAEKKIGGRPKIEEQATVRVCFYITPTQDKKINGSRGVTAKKVFSEYLEGLEDG